MRTSTHFDKELINNFASGHWASIHADLTSLPREILDGGDYPCPICDGHDRFNVCRDSYAETGKLFCKPGCKIHGHRGIRIVELCSDSCGNFDEACSLSGQWLVQHGVCSEADLTATDRRRKETVPPNPQPQPPSSTAGDEHSPQLREYKLPSPRKPRKGFKAPKVHETAAEAMAGVAYGLNQVSSNRKRLLLNERPAHQKFKYFLNPDLCPFIILRWDLREAERKNSDETKVIRPIHKVQKGWQAGNQMNAGRPLYGLYPRLLKSKQPCGEQTLPTGGSIPLFKAMAFTELPDVGNAESVYVVEGEPCAEVLLALGQNAVSPAHGAQSPHKTDWSSLHNAKTITLIPDNDDAGYEFVCEVRGLLAGQAPDAKIIVKDLADDAGLELQEKDDIKDWVHHYIKAFDPQEIENVSGILEGLPDRSDDSRFAAKAPRTQPKAGETQRISDTPRQSPASGPTGGNDEDSEAEEAPNPSEIAAALLALEFSRGNKRTLVHWRGDFYQWSGAWKQMEAGELTSLIGKRLTRDYENPNRNHIANVIAFLQAETFLHGSQEPNTWLAGTKTGYRIAVDNGLLNPATGELEDSTPDWFSPVILPVEFDPDAVCNQWQKILDTNLEGDLERIHLLQEFAGYLLWPTLEFQKFLTLVGEGSNGKSVFIAGLQALLGQSNVSNYALESLGTNRFAAAGTIGRLANLCADVSEVDKLSEGILKQLVSGDRLTLDRKNQPLIEATPTAKLVFSCNNLPRFRDKSSGMTRRMIICPFNREVLAEEKIQGLDRPDAWEDELSGILNWALEGLHRLLKNRSFTDSETCNETVEQYRQDSNPAAVFIEDFLVVNEDPNSHVIKSDVYAAYRHWSDNHGRRALGDAEFAKEVRRFHKGVEDGRKRAGGIRHHVFFGLRLLLHPTGELNA